MMDLITLLRACLQARQPLVLASLVRVEGSSYRRPGARMLLGPGGPLSGSVSGGCLEADLQARVGEVLERREARLVRYDMGTDLDLVWGTGMGCRGVAEVLLEPLRPGCLAPWIPFSERLLDRRASGALATILDPRGLEGFALGDRFAYDDRVHGLQPMDDLLNGDLQRLAARAQAEDRFLEEEAATRLGPVRVLVEPIHPPFALWIYGAAEGARPLAEIAVRLGWKVGVLDHRPGLLTQERFPGASLVPGFPAQTIPGLRLERRSAAVVLSHVFEPDKAACRAFLESPAPYVGLQGSWGRGGRLLGELEAEGLDPASKSRLYHPVGLDLGGESPESIALSILAEAHAVLTGHKGGSLRERQGRIHAPTCG